MPPEQPGAHPPTRQEADSCPLAWRHTGPLRGLLPLLPRVHAADGAVPSPTPPLPQIVGKPEFPDTGWDRIKDLFEKGDKKSYPEELTNVVKSAGVAAVIGLFYGGLPAGRHARERYIQLHRAELYSTRIEAIRSAHNAALRGFIRFGWRWGWRVAAFVTIFNTVSTGLSVYRNRTTLGHYAVAGAVTGGLFRLSLGLGGMVMGTAIGAVLGVPAGAVVVGLQSIGGETYRERRIRERRELYELKLAEWNARLQLTDELIGEMSVSGQDQGAVADLQKIEQLLSSPRNEGIASESGSQ